MARTLDVSAQAISNSCSEGKFPANWRDIVEELVEPLGIDVHSPEFKVLFKMKRPKDLDGQAVAAE